VQCDTRNELLAAETELAQAEGTVKVARVNYQALTGGAPPDGTLETVKPAADIEDHPALRTSIAAPRRGAGPARRGDAYRQP
jgi:outer membrane protein TolC